MLTTIIIKIDFNEENNKEGHKFKIGDNVRLSKYKSIGLKKVLPLKNLKFGAVNICYEWS